MDSFLRRLQKMSASMSILSRGGLRRVETMVQALCQPLREYWRAPWRTKERLSELSWQAAAKSPVNTEVGPLWLRPTGLMCLLFSCNTEGLLTLLGSFRNLGEICDSVISMMWEMHQGPGTRWNQSFSVLCGVLEGSLVVATS
jgi:hypothetical protein